MKKAIARFAIARFVGVLINEGSSSPFWGFRIGSRLIMQNLSACLFSTEKCGELDMSSICFRFH